MRRLAHTKGPAAIGVRVARTGCPLTATYESVARFAADCRIEHVESMVSFIQCFEI
jgi:hypothetical protein